MVSWLASQQVRVSCTKGGAHQGARPKLAAPVPPSAWPLLAAAVMLDGDQPQESRAEGEHTMGWELQIFLSGFHALAVIDSSLKAT